MNILFYQFGVNPQKGGVQRVSYTIAKLLKAQGYGVYVVYQDKDAFTDEMRCAYDDCLKIEGTDVNSLGKLFTFSRKHEISVIINQSGFSLQDTLLLSHLKQEYPVKIYSFIHISPMGSHEVLKFRDFRFPKLVLRSLAKELMFLFYQPDKAKYKRIYSLSDKVVLLTNSFIPDFKTLIGNEDTRHKITAIHNPTSFPMQDESILHHKENILLVVARMGETPKKISRILDCWKMVSGKLKDWQLILVGDGSELQAYKKIAQKEQLPRITFTGLTNPTPYYQKASIFLMTSATEGFSMTLIEAQQYGVVPIVMDAFRSVRDIVSDGENGFITPNKDVKAFAAKVLSLAESEEQRNTMARSAMRLVQRFSENNILAQWNKLLSDEKSDI